MRRPQPGSPQPIGLRRLLRRVPPRLAAKKTHPAAPRAPPYPSLALRRYGQLARPSRGAGFGPVESRATKVLPLPAPGPEEVRLPEIRIGGSLELGGAGRVFQSPRGNTLVPAYQECLCAQDRILPSRACLGKRNGSWAWLVTWLLLWAWLGRGLLVLGEEPLEFFLWPFNLMKVVSFHTHYFCN